VMHVGGRRVADIDASGVLRTAWSTSATKVD